MTNEWWLQIYEYSLRIFIISQDIILTLGMELSNKSAMGGWKYKCTQWKRRRGAHRWGNDGEITDCNCAARANDDWACLCVCFFFFLFPLLLSFFIFHPSHLYLSCTLLADEEQFGRRQVPHFFVRFANERKRELMEWKNK